MEPCIGISILLHGNLRLEEGHESSPELVDALPVADPPEYDRPVERPPLCVRLEVEATGDGVSTLVLVTKRRRRQRRRRRRRGGGRLLRDKESHGRNLLSFSVERCKTRMENSERTEGPCKCPYRESESERVRRAKPSSGGRGFFCFCFWFALFFGETFCLECFGFVKHAATDGKCFLFVFGFRKTLPKLTTCPTQAKQKPAATVTVGQDKVRRCRNQKAL